MLANISGIIYVQDAGEIVFASVENQSHHNQNLGFSD